MRAVGEEETPVKYRNPLLGRKVHKLVRTLGLHMTGARPIALHQLHCHMVNLHCLAQCRNPVCMCKWCTTSVSGALLSGALIANTMRQATHHHTYACSASSGLASGDKLTCAFMSAIDGVSPHT